MIINGEKWACEACVRGHRVSNCQHSGRWTPPRAESVPTCVPDNGGDFADGVLVDRPLQHINKKGRPVSQCPHCRGLRKSRSAHVRCDCGEKPHSQAQCSPLQKVDPGRESSWHTTLPHARRACRVLTGGWPTGDRALCCCTHGSKCTCSLKKEPQLGSVPELDGDLTGPPRPTLHRPRLSATQSEASLMVFANGHHKPAHKHSHMIHKRATPYRIPRRHGGPRHPNLARRSADDLPTDDPVEVGSVTSPIHEPMVQHDVRLVRSEHGSPHLSVSPDLGHMRGALPPLDLSFSNFHSPSTDRPPYEMSGWTPNSMDTYFCATPDSDQPIFSAGLEPPSVDWSAFDLRVGSAGYGSTTHGQRPSYGSFDYNHAGPAYADSTAASDNDELGAFGVPSPLHPPSLVLNHFSSDVSEACESDSYRLSSSSSMHGLPQISLLASGDLEGMTSEDFLAGAATAAATFHSTDALMESGSTPFVPASYSLAEPSKLAPTSAPANDKRYSLPLSTEPMHSLWGPPLDGLPGRHSSSPVGTASESRVPQAVWAAQGS